MYRNIPKNPEFVSISAKHLMKNFRCFSAIIVQGQLSSEIVSQIPPRKLARFLEQKFFEEFDRQYVPKDCKELPANSLSKLFGYKRPVSLL